MGTLFLVATPIGNLEDLSPRAQRILGQASLIAAEDTRLTRRLLTHFGIHTPLTSYFEHNKLSKLGPILQALGEGNVALVSDAGMPAINDPGYELVNAALAAGHEVSPIPGPSAPLAALAVSGLPSDSFLYLGYLPRRGAARRALLEGVAGQPYTLIVLETPHRLLESLQDIGAVLGDRPAAIARELTKVHEQVWRGSVSQAIAFYSEQEPRGEFTLILGGRPRAERLRWAEERVILAVRSGLRLGEPPAKLARRVAVESGWERKEVYHLAVSSNSKAESDEVLHDRSG
jgi:16S rRNA (cytidine1402-2'-O)-methyltransferase